MTVGSRVASPLVACAVVWWAWSCVVERGPHRPASVPTEAFWLGGPDGGAFVLVRKDPADPAPLYRVRVFYENGEPWYDGTLRLDPPEPALDPADRKQFLGWDGEKLLLVGGRVLRAAS